MRTNKLVWVGVGLLLVGVVVVGINAFNSPPAKKMGGELVVAPEQAKSAKTKAAAKPKQVDVTEVAGDTVAESLKDVQVRYEASEKKNMTLEESVKTLSERLAKTESRIGAGQKGDERVNAVASEVNAMKGTFANLAQQFSTQEERLKTTSANGYDFSNEDLGLDGKVKTDRNGIAPSQTTLLPGYVTVKPLGSSGASDAFGGVINNSFNKVGGLASQHLPEQDGTKPALKDKKKKGEITPHYTIPARSTLMDAAAMTAMIGRVPVDGRVQDPFPVKFILGDDNLATNGLTIPGLKGIVFEGVATGNWNLSCVSVELTGATFTFHDGRVQHLPNKDKSEAEGKQDGQLETDPMSSGGSRGGLNPIGYISDPLGVPCIGGKRITDAPQQLATMGILGAAKSYFDAKANAETTNTTNLVGGAQSTVTGDQIKFANNATAAGSVQTVMDFYKSRTRDSFDVIFVNPGADIALHITRDLYVDYNTGSRKLVYSNGGNQHGSSMD